MAKQLPGGVAAGQADWHSEVCQVRCQKGWLIRTLGPGWGGIRGGCFHSVSNTNGNGVSGGQAPLCRPAFLDQLSSWEPGPPSEGPGGVRQTRGAGLGQLGHWDSPKTSPRGGLFREFQGQSVVRLPLPVSQGRSRHHRIPYVSVFLRSLILVESILQPPNFVIFPPENADSS